MNAHLEGRTVSASTYTNHHCRCDGCCAAHSTYQRGYNGRSGYREPKAQQRAALKALAYLRTHQPEVYRSIYDEARAYIKGKAS